MAAIETLLDGLADPVGLAWHDDALWIADRADRRVVRFTPALGELVTVTTLVGDRPGGLAWTSTGLAVTAAGTRAVVEWTGESGLLGRSDLGAAASGALAGVVEAGSGGPWYVVDEGAPLYGPMTSRQPGRIVLVTPEGDARIVADELESPAAIALGPDGRVVFVAERAAGRITSFQLGGDGELTGRRTWCVVPPGPRAHASGPTGLAIGADGSMWCTDTIGARLVAIAPDGSIIGDLAIDGEPTACCLAGDDESVLLVATRPVGVGSSRRRDGRVVVVALDEAGLSRPPVAANAPPG